MIDLDRRRGGDVVDLNGNWPGAHCERQRLALRIERRQRLLKLILPRFGQHIRRVFRSWRDTGGDLPIAFPGGRLEEQGESAYLGDLTGMHRLRRKDDKAHAEIAPDGKGFSLCIGDVRISLLFIADVRRDGHIFFALIAQKDILPDQLVRSEGGLPFVDSHSGLHTVVDQSPGDIGGSSVRLRGSGAGGFREIGMCVCCGRGGRRERHGEIRGAHCRSAERGRRMRRALMKGQSGRILQLGWDGSQGARQREVRRHGR